MASAPVFGVNRGPIRGIAPGAWLAEYKVCGIQGCYQSDSAAAVQQAVLDGVDVINFSISGGNAPYTDPVDFPRRLRRGRVRRRVGRQLRPRGGNLGPPQPLGDDGGASTQTREFATTLNLAGAGGAPALALDGASITAGSGAAPLPIVQASAPPYSDALCAHPAPPGLFIGKIVACQRGGNGRVEKGLNIIQGGAMALVLFNAILADVDTDNHWLPRCISRSGRTARVPRCQPGGDSAVRGGPEAQRPGRCHGGLLEPGARRYLLKPDVPAPGVQILAGHTQFPRSSPVSRR